MPPTPKNVQQDMRHEVNFLTVSWVSGGFKVEVFDVFGGPEWSHDRCQEPSEGAGAVSSASGPEQGARGVQGGPWGCQNRGFWRAWGSAGVPKSASGAFGERWCGRQPAKWPKGGSQRRQRELKWRREGDHGRQK